MTKQNNVQLSHELSSLPLDHDHLPFLKIYFKNPRSTLTSTCCTVEARATSRTRSTSTGTRTTRSPGRLTTPLWRHQALHIFCWTTQCRGPYNNNNSNSRTLPTTNLLAERWRWKERRTKTRSRTGSKRNWREGIQTVVGRWRREGRSKGRTQTSATQAQTLCSEGPQVNSKNKW